MVFMVGKNGNNLAREIIAKEFQHSKYYSWDYQPDRKKINSRIAGEDGY
ncbi:MAG: hypothetical protein U5J96_17965 [Ignavibacteriaceae bacterium]|nr:hypothetical protein [Ignavibacteriaceae bacterium]